jgi:hypothetical protein
MASVKQAIIKNTRHLVLENKEAATVLTKGEILMQTAGFAVPATSSTVRADLLGVCNQSIAAAEALLQVEVIVPSDEDLYIFSTTNNSDSAHNGQAMVLGANSTTVNNTGTTSGTGIIQQVGTIGAVADKLILGRFLTL